MQFYKILFFNSMIFGTLLSISSFSWFTMWMGLEINLLSIIPLMNNSKNMYPSEASIKYFITQVIASSLILIAIMINLNMLEYIPQYFNLYLNMMMNSGFLMKMGAAPFHFWLPEIMEGLNWLMNLIMLTWQKIAPMILLMNNFKLNLFMCTVIIFSSLISGIQGLNQISLRKIMAFSSINHIAWMLSSMSFSYSIWLIYFITYSLISMNFILIFYNFNVFFLKQLYNTMNFMKTMKTIFSLNFLSLGGLPPFLGFLPKWLTINYLILNNYYSMSFIVIVLTLMTLFYYLRMALNSLIIYSNESMNKIMYVNPSIMSFNIIILMSLIFSNLIINL
uniref:NADH-ubiquinone oxidoreductase chain 2 n=1 Tax=Nitidulidae sp. BMNH 1274727 TaxID=1796524 RepID=A0A126TGM0_9CUCU|nr:NADH dehydrogenase subunit 2 [Nitidulidae sp. BMNH 1274727]